MVLTGSEVFALGVAVTVLTSIVSFIAVSIGLAYSRNKRRANLVEARRLQGIPEAIIVEDEDGAKGPGGGAGANDGKPTATVAADLEEGTVVAMPTSDGADGDTTAVKRKNKAVDGGDGKKTAEEKRKMLLKEMVIPAGEVYDGAYGKRETAAGVCYTIFTRKSTVVLHLRWVKITSYIVLVLQAGFLGISVARGLYLLAFPQFGVASVAAALFMAMYSLHQDLCCCFRWALFAIYLPVVMAADLLDAASLGVEYACMRDGSPCSKFTAEVCA